MADIDLAKILEQYRALKSPYEIARNLGTTAGVVRRRLQKAGEPLRNRSQAQVAALKTGRKPHPTLGVGHSDATKRRISEAQQGRAKPRKTT